MRIRWGTEVSRNQERNGAEYVYDTSALVSPHVLVLGDTGMGKSHALRHYIQGALKSTRGPLRIHLFEVHGDMEVPGASSVVFSDSTDFGFNPLELNPDPKFGGVRKCIRNFITIIGRTSYRLGHRQEAVLRNLLEDLYAREGFRVDDPSSWAPNVEIDPEAICKPGRIYLDVPFEEKDALKALCRDAAYDRIGRQVVWHIPQDAYTGRLLRWGKKHWGRRYPTLLDAVRYANQRFRAMHMGSNQAAIRLLEDVNRQARSLMAKELAAMRAGEDAPQFERLQDELAAAKQKAIQAYTEYVSAIKSGRELDEQLRFDSPETLKSILDRLENLNAIGIFRPNPPPFDSRSPIWRYDICGLNNEEQSLFVEFRLESIFALAKQRGERSEITDVIVLDEAHKFVSKDDEHILSRLAREARKFGIALVLASQSPKDFTPEMIAAMATKVILGLDPISAPTMRNAFGIPDTALKAIVPQERILIQSKLRGQTANACKLVQW